MQVEARGVTAGRAKSWGGRDRREDFELEIKLCNLSLGGDGKGFVGFIIIFQASGLRCGQRDVCVRR